MQSQESQNIIALITRVFRKRKLFIGLCILGLLIPTIYYNETTAPVYEAGTMMIFDEIKDPVSTYNIDISREIMMSNRLEEMKSLAFSEDIVADLPIELYDKFKIPEGEDKINYITKKINKNIHVFPVRASNIIRISVETQDPELSMTIANTAAKVVHDRINRARQEGVSGVRTFIEQQLERFASKLNESDEKLKRFKQRNKITSIDKESRELLRKLTAAEVLKNSVTADRQSARQRLNTIQSRLASQKQNLVPSITDISTPTTQKLKEKFIALREQFTDLRVQGYETSHPKMVQLQSDIKKIQQRLADEANKVALADNVVDPIASIQSLVNESFTLQAELEGLQAEERALERTIDNYELLLGSLPDKEYKLAKLTRERVVTDKIYTTLLEKREEAKISEAEKIANVRIIDKARMPFEPIRPRKKMNLAIALILGSVIGVGTAFGMEVMSRTLKSSEELEEVTQWPVLASIPIIENENNHKLNFLNKHTNGNSKTPRIKGTLVTGLEAKSGAAETYRILRTNLQFLGVGKDIKTIMVTSIGPDEGKSTTVTNLGITLARMQQNVLMVDADLRRPLLHSLFEIDKEPGLSDLLVYHNTVQKELSLMQGGDNLEPGFTQDTPATFYPKVRVQKEQLFSEEEIASIVDNLSDFDMDSSMVSKINNIQGANNSNFLNSSLIEAIQSTNIENLKILTSGKQLKNPSETISNLSMKSLLEELKSKFDVVLIDSAPILLVPESMVISSLVDGVVLVVDSKKYNKDLILKAKHLLENAKAKVIGTVLNNVDFRDQYYENGYYYYDSNA